MPHDDVFSHQQLERCPMLPSKDEEQEDCKINMKTTSEEPSGMGMLSPSFFFGQTAFCTRTLNVVTPQIVDDKRLPETDDVQIKLEDAEQEGLANVALVKEPATSSSLYTFICPFYIKTDYWRNVGVSKFEIFNIYQRSSSPTKETQSLL